MRQAMRREHLEPCRETLELCGSGAVRATTDALWVGCVGAVAVRNCRSVKKKDMKLNDKMPVIKVDPETYEVSCCIGFGTMFVGPGPVRVQVSIFLLTLFWVLNGQR